MRTSQRTKVDAAMNSKEVKKILLNKKDLFTFVQILRSISIDVNNYDPFYDDSIFSKKRGKKQ